MLALLSGIICIQIDQLSTENLNHTGEEIQLNRSYSHGDISPLFTTQIISEFKGNFNGNGHTISNIRINQSSNLQSIFGYCTNATIQNVSLKNVTFMKNGVTSSKVAVLTSYATNTIFKNISINVEGLLSIEQDFSLICNQCKNITLENVTINSFHLSTNLTGGLNLFNSIEGSTVKNVNMNISIQFLKVKHVNLLSPDSKNTQYSKIQVYGSHEIFQYDEYYSMMFNNSQSDSFQDGYYNQQVTLFSASKNNYLFGPKVMSTTKINQVQFVTQSNEPFDGQTNATVQNSGYFLINITNPVAGLIKLNIDNQQELDNFYKNFSNLQTDYYLNNNGLYVIGNVDELKEVTQKILCNDSNQCLNNGTCQSTSTGVNSLGINMNVFSCKCAEGFYGTHCEKQIVKNDTECANGNRGFYCTVCNISLASVNGTCQPNCVIHGGYDQNFTKCNKCQQNYTGTHCTSCNVDYIRLNTTCFWNIGNCVPNPGNTSCVSCNSNNYTGDLCETCSTEYKYNQSSKTCFFDYNNLCLTTGGYNLNTNACRDCPVNSNGQVCFSASTPNTTLCAMNGGLETNNQTCKLCQTGYTGNLCQNCDTSYVKKGDFCVQPAQCTDSLFELSDNTCNLKYNCSAYGGLDFNLQECRKCTGNRAQPFCLNCRHMYQLQENTCVCQSNYTGNDCQNCKTGYYKYQEPGKTQYSCFLDQRNRCLPNPYNPILEKCRYCELGKVGNFCQECAAFASGTNCASIDYNKLCQIQNATYEPSPSSTTGKCSSCLKEYFGPLCSQCAGRYEFDATNSKCVENATTFCNIYLNQEENEKGIKLGKCNRCLYNTSGPTCQSCAVHNFLQQYDSKPQIMCMINQSDPVNKIPASIILQCQVHGGVTDNLECAKCQHGFEGPYCLECGAGFYRFNETTCKNNNSKYCVLHGGWDEKNNKCNDCKDGTGDFCQNCITNASYYSTTKYTCELVESYVDTVNRVQIDEKRSLVIACAVIAAIIILCVIALVLTIVLCRRKAAERAQVQEPGLGDNVKHEQSIVAAAHLNNQTSAQLTGSGNS